MKVPKFSRWITIPVLLILNFLAWLYIYDDYMMGWVIIYPLFIVVAAAFTTAAEVAFGKDKQVKYIGINICIILLLLVFAQKYFPMEQIENNLKNNYYDHVLADVVELAPTDKAVRINGLSIVVRNYQDNSNTQVYKADALEVYKDGNLIDKITVSEAAAKIEEIVPLEKSAEYSTLLYNDVRYTGVKKKGGSINLVFAKGHVNFGYDLVANEKGFIWESDKYKFGGFTLPAMEGLYGDATNKKIKDILMKGDKEQLITVEVTIQGDIGEAVKSLKNMGYEVIAEDPISVRIPFYEIANLSHQEYVQFFEIR
ncbi:MAG: hypothetical protein JM58_04745 [Peptococcaceae bacterium BICA1-8]|nr:MAG: hypothetical protein JM58_04745 [Peptococcaceae bacterium BICA1-8]